MQSGLGKSDKWLIEFETEDHRLEGYRRSCAVHLVDAMNAHDELLRLCCAAPPSAAHLSADHRKHYQQRQ